MSNSIKCYAVYGKNGLGVLESEERAQLALRFLKKSDCQVFTTREEAVSCALQEYGKLSRMYFKGPIPMNTVIKTSIVEYIKKLKFNPKETIQVKVDETGKYCLISSSDRSEQIRLEDIKEEKEYIGLVAANGLGVFDDELRADESCKYLKGHEARVYKNFEKAVKDTIDRYNRRVMKQDVIEGYYNENQMELNWIYYRKNL